MFQNAKTSEKSSFDLAFLPIFVSNTENIIGSFVENGLKTKLDSNKKNMFAFFFAKRKRNIATATCGCFKPVTVRTGTQPASRPGTPSGALRSTLRAVEGDSSPPCTVLRLDLSTWDETTCGLSTCG